MSPDVDDEDRLGNEGDSPVRVERRVEPDSRYTLFASQVNAGRRILWFHTAWLFVVGVLSIYLLIQNGDRAGDIQAQRREATLTTCVGQNRRHTEALRIIRREPRAGAAFAEELVDAVVPYQNCAERVKEVVK